MLYPLIVAVVIFVNSLAQADQIGVYTGSFDPPTKAHFAIMEKALQQKGLNHLYILVNRDGAKGKDYHTSSDERVQMLKAGAEARTWGSKIEFLPMLNAGKGPFIQSLLAQHNLVTEFIGQDSYEALPKQLIEDKRLSWVVFPRDGQTPAPHERVSILLIPDTLTALSSTTARKALRAGQDPHGILDDVVLQKISQFHAYQTDDPTPARIAEKNAIDALTTCSPSGPGTSASVTGAQ